MDADSEATPAADDFFHDRIRNTGRCAGMLDALRVTSEYMRSLDGPAYEAVKALYQLLDAKYEEIGSAAS